LRHHGGAKKEEYNTASLDKVAKGFENLEKHIENCKKFGITPVVALNHFPTDTAEELAFVQSKCAALGVKAVVSDGILLIGELVKDGNNPKAFALTPKQPITTELYGCILPKNDSAWKGFIDSVVASPENHDLQEEWFSVDKSKFPYLVRTDPR
jgi:hypothetical protein